MVEEPDIGEGERLPRELRSLIHHVELHRSGWWDRALERLVLVTLWRQAPASVDDVMGVLSVGLDGRLSRDRVEAVVAQAHAAGTIVETIDGTFKPSEEVDRALRAELDEVHAAEERVKDRLVGLAADAGLDVDPEELWQDFEGLFMLPLVREAGARIYEVLTSTTDIDVAVPTYVQILNPLCEKYGPDVRSVLVDFLDPADGDVRGYVLRTLNADFVREAAGLESDVLDGLKASRGRPDRVRVFLDTNFLFSFLELHDNPSNEVAADLIELIDRAKSTIKIELFVLPITVEETRRVLRDVMSKLSGIAPGRNVAAAARQLHSTGLVARFLEAAADYSRGILKPDDFFGPYESNLVPVIRDRGVELFNTDLDALRMDQGVIDDIHDQAEVQKRVRKRGSKSYESNLHDMVLWHFTFRERPVAVDSPLEVGNWVCTVDYGLIAFDRHKRRGTQRQAVCVTPSSLIQLLQFWAPRTEELDRALVGAIREPLLFLDFDSSAEQATLRILRSMSRFEGVADLSTSTIYSVLTNDALRARLEAKPALPPGEDLELVEAAVVDEARRLEAELAELHRDRAVVTASAEGLEEKVREAEGLRDLLAKRDEDVSALSSEVDALRLTLENEREAGESKVKALESGQDQLHGRLEQIENDQAHRRDARRLGVAIVGAILIGILAAVVGGRFLADTLEGAEWVAWASAATASLLLVLLACEAIIRGRPQFAEGRIARALVQSRKAILVLLVGVLGSLIAAAIWEAVAGDDAPQTPTESTPSTSG